MENWRIPHPSHDNPDNNARRLYPSVSHDASTVSSPTSRVTRLPSETDSRISITMEAAQPEPPQEVAWVESMPAAADKSENAPVWKMYLDKADEYDNALIQKWNGSLDVFLLFTGLFSAILSAFIIVSWSDLQPDNVQATVDGLVAVSQQLVLLSTGQPIDSSSAYQPAAFVASWTAIIVNFLWFTGLFISLLSAVLAMLVKEWLSMYNEGKEVATLARVVQRQARFGGLQTWMVPTIVSLLPISIHVAVMLFLVGLVVFVRDSSPALSWMMAGLLLGGASLWFLSSLIPLIRPDCPYKSPLYVALKEIWKRVRQALRSIIGACRTIAALFIPISVDLERGAVSSSRSTFTDHFEPREKTYLRTQSTQLQAGALAWLCRSSDPEAQEAALHFLSWWRMPLRTWRTVRDEVEKASVAFVNSRLAQRGTLGHPPVLEERELEKVALISGLFPQNASFDRGLIRSVVDNEEHSPSAYRQHLALSLLSNLQSNSGYDKNPYSELRGTFKDCTNLELCFHRIRDTNVARNARLVALIHWSNRLPISNIPRPFLYKYACLLGVVLKVSEPECTLSSNEWVPRYPIGVESATVSRVLLACVQRLYSPTPFPRYYSSAVTTQVALTFLRYIGVRPELLRYGTAATHGDTLNAVTARLATVTDAPDWYDSDVTDIMFVALLRSADPRGAVWQHPETFVSCMPAVMRCCQTLRPHQRALETCIQPSTVQTWARWFTRAEHAQEWIKDGSWVKLLAAIDGSTTSLYLPALVIAWAAVQGPMYGLHDQWELRPLVSKRWLRWTMVYGIDYVCTEYPERHSEDQSSALSGLFEDTFAALLGWARARTISSGVVQKYFMHTGVLIGDWTQSEQDDWTDRQLEDERRITTVVDGDGAASDLDEPEGGVWFEEEHPPWYQYH